MLEGSKKLRSEWFPHLDQICISCKQVRNSYLSCLDPFFEFLTGEAVPDTSCLLLLAVETWFAVL
jgi:hypothetical protein